MHNSVWATSPLGVVVRLVICGVYLFFFLLVMLPSEIPKLTTDLPVRVSWCLETSPPLRLPPWDESMSLTLLSLFIFYILSYLLLKTMGCPSGYLVSSTSIQKLFCGIFSCSNDVLMNLWGRKWSPRLIPPPS